MDYFERAFQRAIDNVALTRFGKGEGTGAMSKTLSSLTFLVLTVLLVTLLEDERYVWLATIAILGFTTLSVPVMVGALGYFLYSGYYFAASLIALYFIIALSAGAAGYANVKKLILSGKPIIGPFEGMIDTALLLILQCLSLGLAIYFTGWIRWTSATACFLISLCIYGRIAYRTASKWRQVHFPLTFRYAVGAGKEMALATVEGREFDVFRAIDTMMETVYPGSAEIGASSRTRVLPKAVSFSDRELLDITLSQTEPALSPAERSAVLDELAKLAADASDNALMLRYAIADVIEDLYGRQERGTYLLAVFSGKAQ